MSAGYYIREASQGVGVTLLTASETEHNQSKQAAKNANITERCDYPENMTLKEVEKAHILNVVELNNGNKSAAARQLGVARKTLERKFKEWNGGFE